MVQNEPVSTSEKSESENGLYADKTDVLNVTLYDVVKFEMSKLNYLIKEVDFSLLISTFNKPLVTL